MPQSTTDAQIRARVDQFVTELSGLIREAALESVSEAIARSGLGPAPHRTTKKKASRKKAGRRRASSGADLADPVLAHIKANPGSRAEEIARTLGANGEDVKRALQGLKAAGAVKARGKARGTNYVAAGRGGGGATRKKKAARKKGVRRKRASRKPSSPDVAMA